MTNLLRALSREAVTMVFTAAAERWLPVYTAIASDLGLSAVTEYRRMVDRLWMCYESADAATSRELYRDEHAKPLELAPDGDTDDNLKTTIAQDLCSLLEAAICWPVREDRRLLATIESTLNPIRVAYSFEETGSIDLAGASDEQSKIEGLKRDARFIKELRAVEADIHLVSSEGVNESSVRTLRERAASNQWSVGALGGLDD